MKRSKIMSVDISVAVSSKTHIRLKSMWATIEYEEIIVASAMMEHTCSITTANKVAMKIYTTDAAQLKEYISVYWMK